MIDAGRFELAVDLGDPRVEIFDYRHGGSRPVRPNRSDTCFGKPGEAAARVLAKGWLVAVAGRLSYRAWEADDGSKRHDYEVVGNIEFLLAPRGDGAGRSEPDVAVSS